MAISYNKTNWVNNETKLNAENLNHIEDGIKNVTDEVNKIEDGTVVAEKANKDRQGLVIHETYETKNAANAKLAEAKTYADDKVAGLDVAEAGSDGSYIEKISETDGKITATVQEFDSTPTNNSNKGVKSGGVKSYVDNAIADLDAAEVGGNGKYIKAIS